MPCSVVELAEPLQEGFGRHDVSAFTLNRLDDDRSDLVGRDQVDEDLLADERERRFSAGVGAAVEPIGVRIRRVIDARHQRPESAALHRLARRERQRPERATVERSEERDDPRPLGVIARQLHGRLGRFGARVAEERPHLAFNRDERRHFLREPHLRLVVEIGPRHVDELRRLIGNGLDDVGVRDAGGIDRDAGRAVEKDVAVDVLDDGAFAAGDDERIVARVGRRHEFRVLLDDRPGLRARRRSLDVRGVFIVVCQRFCRGSRLSLYFRFHRVPAAESSSRMPRASEILTNSIRFGEVACGARGAALPE